MKTISLKNIPVSVRIFDLCVNQLRWLSFSPDIVSTVILRFSFALFFFCLHSTCISANNPSKEELVKTILLTILDREVIDKQESELIENILTNLKKANEVLLRDMLEWKQSESDEKLLREKFLAMEREAFKKLKLRLEKKLSLYQLVARSSMKLYIDSFNMKDLLVLRKFYATAAGKKSLQLAKKSQEHYLEAINKHLIPEATKISTEAQKELVESFMIQEP